MGLSNSSLHDVVTTSVSYNQRSVFTLTTDNVDTGHNQPSHASHYSAVAHNKLNYSSTQPNADHVSKLPASDNFSQCNKLLLYN